jgi:hypothetical protein
VRFDVPRDGHDVLAGASGDEGVGMTVQDAGLASSFLLTSLAGALAVPFAAEAKFLSPMLTITETGR